MTDQQIVDGLKAGFGTPQYEAVAKHLITTLTPRVMGYVMQNSGTKDDGWDLFTKLLELFTERIDIVADRLISIGFARYFMGAVRFKWLDELRRRDVARRRTGEMTENMGDDEDILDRVFDDYANEVTFKYEGYLLPAKKLMPLLEKWGNEEGKRLLLRFYDGCGSQKLAEEEGITDGAMRTRLTRLRQDFADFVEKELIISYLEKWNNEEGRKLLKRIYVDKTTKRRLAKDKGVSIEKLNEQLEEYLTELRKFIAKQLSQ